jgi:nicotinamidase/pyrazinamidase
MSKKNAILIIDAQYDFCNPNGALFVAGADADMQRLNNFIIRNKNQIDYICVTLDTHPIHDISHPSFWEDAQHQSPAPFTQITLAEVQSGKWKPKFFAKEATEYLTKLEAQGQFPHFIWPEHCLIGSKGAAIDEILMEALKIWAKDGKEYQTVCKGTYPLSEHFGIFAAQIPVADRPETQLNTTLINTLQAYDHVYLAGQAKSHCVATSLKQAMDFAPTLAQKMIILEDTMSDVTGLGHLGQPIYQQAKQQGIQFANSTLLI